MTRVEIVRALLEPQTAIRLAVVFGSSANTSVDSPGDLDLALSLHEGMAAPAGLDVILERATGLTTDLIWMDTAPPLLRFEIARQGTVVLERQPYAWADFRARAALDWWDWAPTAAIIERTMVARLREEATRGPS